MLARLCWTAAAYLSMSMPGFAQQKANFAGEFSGNLGPSQVRLHLVAGPGGTVTGTVDSPSQNLFGLKCDNLQVNGNSLSFTVPAVHGAWVGFLSENANSLSGMWSQGATMQLNFTRASASGPATAAVPGEVKWDDYVFRFSPDGKMATVFLGDRAVGVIITMNGVQQVTGSPGPDLDKLKASFADYQAFSARTHSGGVPASTPPPPGSPPTAAASPSPAVPGSAPMVGATGVTSAAQTADQRTPVASIQFDESTHSIVVPRPDGLIVTFVGQDVKISAARGGGGYILRHQKGSAGRFFEKSIEHSNDTGGSLSGGGVEFLHDGGGLIFDSGMGAYGSWQANPQILEAKRLSIIAVAAVTDVRQAPGHENFAPPGYDTIKQISQYRLRSDGSR
jgi:hypothetical protein